MISHETVPQWLIVEYDAIIAHMRKRIDQIEPRGKSLVRSHAQKVRRAREREYRDGTITRWTIDAARERAAR